MNLIYSKDLLDFVEENKDKDCSKILLSTSQKKYNFNLKYACKLIEAKAKIKHKFPDWYNNSKLVFISAISSEQSSSFLAAEYKSKIISNSLVVDLTGGMGVDSYFFSINNNKVYYNEKESDLMKATEYNFKTLKIVDIHCSNISIDRSNLDQYLFNICNLNSISKIPLIYLDPSRRLKTGDRFIGMEDYEPNILEILDILNKYANHIVVKISPMSDISKVFNSCRYINKIEVISINNECKELLIHILPNSLITYKNLKIESINITNNSVQKFSHSIIEESEAIPYLTTTITTGEFIYDPNSSILKSGGFKTVSKLYNLNKLDINTHLYSSVNLNRDFPGRIFKVIEVIEFKSKNINNLYKIYPTANIITKNFTLNSQSLKKRLNIDDGGNIYLIGCTINSSKKLLVCNRVI